MKKIQWPTAAALIVVVIVIGAAYLFGPSLGVDPDTHASFVAGVGAVGAFILATMRSVLGKDKDHDGIPDIVDGRTDPPKEGMR